MFEKIIKIEVSGVVFSPGLGAGTDYAHIIKTTNKGRYALRKNGEWFKIDEGGGLLRDCTFTRDDKSLDIWLK